MAHKKAGGSTNNGRDSVSTVLRLGYPPRGLLGVAGKIIKWVKSGLMMMVPIYAKVSYRSNLYYFN
jgi:hypothetical protein